MGQEADISEATVVTLYLLRSLNILLGPKLLSELKPVPALFPTTSTWATSGNPGNASSSKAARFTFFGQYQRTSPSTAFRVG